MLEPTARQRMWEQAALAAAPTNWPIAITSDQAALQTLAGDWPDLVASNPHSTPAVFETLLGSANAGAMTTNPAAGELYPQRYLERWPVQLFQLNLATATATQLQILAGSGVDVNLLALAANNDGSVTPKDRQVKNWLAGVRRDHATLPAVYAVAALTRPGLDDSEQRPLLQSVLAGGSDNPWRHRWERIVTLNISVLAAHAAQLPAVGVAIITEQQLPGRSENDQLIVIEQLHRSANLFDRRELRFSWAQRCQLSEEAMRLACSDRGRSWLPDQTMWPVRGTLFNCQQPPRLLGQLGDRDFETAVMLAVRFDGTLGQLCELATRL